VASLFQRLFPADEVEERPAPDEQPAPLIRPDSEQGLIPAKELPSAANALAELFPEETPNEHAEAENPAKTAPKRRNIFFRLFSPKPPDAAPIEAPIPNESILSETAQMDAVVVATPIEVREEDFTVVKGVAATDETSIPADALPSAALVLEELFPPESIPVEHSLSAEEEAVFDAPSEQDGPTEGAETNEADVPTEADRPTQAGVTTAEAAVDAVESVSSEGNADKDHSELRNEGQAESSSVTEDFWTASVEEPMRDLASGELEEKPAEKEDVRFEASDAEVDEEQAKTREEDPEDARENSDDAPAENWPALAETLVAAANTQAPRTSYKDWAFVDKLASHKEWVESHGATGKKADLAAAELEATEMIGVNLRFADLHDANLRSADLLLADLRDACMVRADMEDACLVGANLEGANLEGASLETAMGLVPRQLAGANLRDALLAPQLMEFEAQTAFVRASQNAFRYFGAMTAASVVSWLVIWRTRDIQLLTDSSVIPFLHSRTAAAALPTAESYLIMPVTIFILYIVFHFHLQKLWDSVQELPAIFPDGHTLGDDEPGIIVGLLRTHFRWMNPDPSSTRLVERGISLGLAYWIVPMTLLLYWARYLTRQEIHGTILQALLVVMATGVAIYATTKVGRPQERWVIEKKWAQGLVAKVKAISPVKAAAVLGLALVLLSVGTITGVPHEWSRSPQYGRVNIRRWVPSALWGLGFDPYADVTEGAISVRPRQPVEDDQIASVDGARLNNVNFRYAQAYGIFLVNAHLWRADFEGAFMSEADLRGADLGQSNLRLAVMDQAHMYHANLDRSNLDGADLRRADLHNANLSYCSLANTILADARLDGASLYTSRLDGATMTRANLQKADLRDASLGNAHLDHADFRGAYLWSAKLPGADLGGAQLGNAILIDADLHGANLGGAQLSGTVLNGANLSGTSLEGADLRGALGLSANQVCSSKSRNGALLDPDMETQVDAQCGTAQP
jgi:uncharacterized protein YjbI with pentapeptide repeats